MEQIDSDFFIRELRKESNDLVERAFKFGFGQGKNETQSKMIKVDTAEKMSLSLLDFINKFKATYVNGEIRYSDGEFIYTKQRIVQIFLHKYGYDS